MPSGIRYSTIILIFILLPLCAQAQYRQKPSIWEGFSITPRVGVNFFYGDLVDNSRTSYSLGVVAERELTTYLSGRFQLMGGQMKGTQIFGDTDLEYAHLY